MAYKTGASVGPGRGLEIPRYQGEVRDVVYDALDVDARICVPPEKHHDQGNPRHAALDGRRSLSTLLPARTGC